MTHAAFALETPDGVPLRMESWQPEGEARASVVVVHGWAEHVGRYDAFARAMTGAGYYVTGADHRGMGASGGERGDIGSFETYARDLEAVIEDVRGAYGPRPLFIYAHGFGALIELLRLRACGGVDPRIAGSVIAAPLLSLATSTPIRDRVARSVLRWVAPRAPRRPAFDVATLCRDQLAADARLHDPRCAVEVSTAWTRSLRGAMRSVRENIGSIRAPTLWLVPTADRLADHRAALRCFERLENPERDAQVVDCVEGAFHEVHNEPAALREEAFEAVLAWFEGRLAKLS